MTVKATAHAEKQLRKLPKNIQEKARKAFYQLAEDPYHPALNSKKMAGSNRFEARLDYHYRFTYEVADNTAWVRTIGRHDEGLGKK